MDFPPLPHPEPLGMLINNRYQIQKLLGRGGFGQTYLAYDTQCFNHPCVLKELAPASRAEYAVHKARELFEREARILYEINHPQIPRFLAWFVDQGRLFLVQEYISGKTYAQLLRQRQQQGQTFSEAEVVRWLLDLMPVLDYLHQRQIVHRDISPDNVMLPDRPEARPVLIDFGLVKQTLSQLRSQMTNSAEPASFVGKFGYAPPEQIRMGQCSPSSDLYALGVTALVLLTGQEPRLLMDQETLEWHWRDYVKISDRLAQLLERMLYEKPKARYQSVAELMRDLRPAPSRSVPARSAVPRSVSPRSVPPPPPVQFPSGSSVATSSAAAPVPRPELPPDFLQRCQQELTSRIGPIARFVLDHTLTQHPHATPAELIDELALEIPDPAQAHTFRANLAAVLPASPSFSVASPPSASPHRSSTTRSTPAPTSLSPEYVSRCQQALTRCIGPVASLILDELLMHHAQMTPQQLVEAIVAEIPDLQQAQAFRKLME